MVYVSTVTKSVTRVQKLYRYCFDKGISCHYDNFLKKFEMIVEYSDEDALKEFMTGIHQGVHDRFPTTATDFYPNFK